MKQKSEKRILVQILMIFLIILILCTFLSKTFYHLFLPSVEVTNPKWAELPIVAETDGEIVMENNQSICYNVSLNIIAVLVEENDVVNAGDVLFEVNSTEFEIEIQKKELEIQQINSQLSEWHSYKEREQLNTQLSIAEKELELYKEQTPYTGQICAESNGVISNIAVSVGSYTAAGEAIAEFATGEQNLSVKFLFQEEEGELCAVGDSIQITYKNTEMINEKAVTKEKKEKVFITKKVYDTQLKQYVFYAVLSDGLEQLYIGKKVKVSYTISSDAYNTVISLNAISEDTQGNSVVYVLHTRTGLFGEESYVEKITVDQMAKNNVNAAITGSDISEYSKIVISSSRALTNGETVRVA